MQVIDILGKAGENTTEMHAILAEFGLPYVYPKSVETAADKIPAEISAEEIAKREDFRKVTTFTIDPKVPSVLSVSAKAPLPSAETALSPDRDLHGVPAGRRGNAEKN